MKKFYFLTLALICAIITNAKDLYLLPSSEWLQANARFEVYTWANGDQWATFNEIKGTDYYVAEIPDNTNGFVLLRKNPASSTASWEGEWARYEPTNYDSTKNLVTVTGWNQYSMSTISTPTPSYPETLFAIGTLSVGSWDPSKCVELNKTGNGVFEGTFTIVNNGDGYGYFGFVVNKGADSNDWSINANRYGAKAGNDTTVELGDESELTKTENVWRAKVTDNAGMVITVTVDLPNSKLTITGLVTGIEEIGIDDVPAVYYNLQGVKVANPENGIFIKRQGSKATKVVL